MRDGSHENSHHRDEHDTAEQCVKSRKEFARGAGNGIQRAHAGENHRRIGESVDPFQFSEFVITVRPEEQCRDYDQHDQSKAAQHAQKKFETA